MKLRTYYWNDRIIGSTRLRLRAALRRPTGLHFRVGNAGDIMTRDLIRHLYSMEPQHVIGSGHRFVPIGSVGHQLRNGDVVAGIGVKDAPIPRAQEARLNIIGLRGPISLERFAQAGHDVSQVRFLFDPGLLIRDICGLDSAPPPDVIRGRRVFVPHYRQRSHYASRMPDGLHLLDIDAHPRDVALEIMRSEVVYASSLHGVIFAHALGRPCVVVAPDDAESQMKYEDYFLSVGLDWKRPHADLDAALRHSAPVSPADVQVSAADFSFPTVDELRASGAIVD